MSGRVFVFRFQPLNTLLQPLLVFVELVPFTLFRIEHVLLEQLQFGDRAVLFKLDGEVLVAAIVLAHRLSE